MLASLAISVTTDACYENESVEWQTRESVLSNANYFFQQHIADTPDNLRPEPEP